MLAGSEPGQPGEWKAKVEVEESTGRAQCWSVQDPIETKIHPRLCCGCKVRVKPGSHHRPAVAMQGSGKPGDAGDGNAEGR